MMYFLTGLVAGLVVLCALEDNLSDEKGREN